MRLSRINSRTSLAKKWSGHSLTGRTASSGPAQYFSSNTCSYTYLHQSLHPPAANRYRLCYHASSSQSFLWHSSSHPSIPRSTCNHTFLW